MGLIKILRLGYTESDLLFIYFLLNYSTKKINIMDDNFLKNKTKNMLLWFYTTSGFYDKTIGTVNINCISSPNFIKYIEILINAIKTSTKCIIHFHEFIKKYSKYFNEFVEFLNNNILFEFLYDDFNNYNRDYLNNYDINKFMENKNILLINPLSELMVKQYKNGNVYKAINVDFPIVKDIIFYKNCYTFFNDGPHDNNLLTYYSMCNNLKNIESTLYDRVVISCGSYSCLLADFLSKNLKKDVFVIGGELNEKFAIKTQRLKQHKPDFIYNKHWISIPENLKPNDYQKIEDGCYW